MTEERRELAWARYQGAFANLDRGPASSAAVIGVASDRCPCCDERYVVIAAVHPSGAEVSVSLTPEAALEVANAILDAFARGRPQAKQ